MPAELLLIYRRDGGSVSNQDPLNLVERDLVARAVVQFCRPRRLMGCNLLRVFESPVAMHTKR